MGLAQFPCSGCGACCRRIDKAVKAIGPRGPDSPFYFPYGWDETGRCEKLEGNSCLVYHDRPLICNVNKLVKFLDVDAQYFFKETAKACNLFMEEDQLPLELRLPVDA
jgi:Fe-S-cluster containining protein